jgi:tetratricopeptide (TPR) repeat protein
MNAVRIRFRHTVLALCLLPMLASAQAPSAPAGDAGIATPAAVAPADDPLLSIQQRWAAIKYELPKAQRAEAFAALAKDAAAARVAHPDDLRLVAWEGIVLASEAGAEGGLGALSLVKQAKADFEVVIAADPNLLDGSALISLGSLYYQVPGWPIGFGNDKKAREFLERGLQVAPDGLDANFFYADFLIEEGELDAAERHLQKALSAADRPGRAVADAGRREEVRAALARIADER